MVSDDDECYAYVSDDGLVDRVDDNIGWMVPKWSRSAGELRFKQETRMFARTTVRAWQDVYRRYAYPKLYTEGGLYEVIRQTKLQTGRSFASTTIRRLNKRDLVTILIDAACHGGLRVKVQIMSIGRTIHDAKVRRGHVGWISFDSLRRSMACTDCDEYIWHPLTQREHESRCSVVIRRKEEENRKPRCEICRKISRNAKNVAYESDILQKLLEQRDKAVADMVYGDRLPRRCDVNSSTRSVT